MSVTRYSHCPTPPTSPILPPNLPPAPSSLEGPCEQPPRPRRRSPAKVASSSAASADRDAAPTPGSTSCVPRIGDLQGGPRPISDRLQRLSETIVRLFLVEGRAPWVIAHHLRLSEVAVRKVLHRAAADPRQAPGDGVPAERR